MLWDAQLTDLEDGWLDPGVAHQIHKQCAIHIRDAQVLDEPQIHELLECRPSLPEWHGVVLDLAIPVDIPAGWVALIRGNVCQ